MSMHRKLNTWELARISIDEFKTTSRIPVVVVMDNVRSLNNIGSVFRTSDAIGIESVILCGISATPPHADIHKTALGAEESVPWTYHENTIDALKTLKESGYSIYGIEQTSNSKNILDFNPLVNRKNAFVFGNELKGVSQEAIDLCDDCLEIPQFGTKHSFNVAVTVGIILWDYYSKVYYSK